MNKLYFGDCLDILKDLHTKHPEGFIDLIYIDPPFNSERNYNILFENIELNDTKAQKEAFADTWSNISFYDTLNELHELDLNIYNFIHALDKININKSAISYLSTMGIRLFYMHKVLKSTGSFYLHCDPYMSHFLKILMDLIFGGKNFRREIIWSLKTSSGYKSKALNWIRAHDTILYYTKSEDFVFNKEYAPHKPEYLARFNKVDENGRMYRDDRDHGRIQYLDETPGVAIGDVWDDVMSFQQASTIKEYLGYPTQKPEKLLEKIISTSSNQGDLVADFFCGCGTTIAVANRLKREWLGVDISHLAIKLIIDRLTKPYQKRRAKLIMDSIEVTGFPKDLASARELATNTDVSRFGFQDWIVEVMLGGVSNPKKTADGGYDGYLTFYKTPKEKGTILIEVKSGKVSVKNMREFIQVVNQNDADIGIFVCFRENLTKPMQLEAKKQGHFQHEFYNNKINKIQIITVDELLEGKEINLPSEFFSKELFKKSTKKAEDDSSDQNELFNDQ